MTKTNPLMTIYGGSTLHIGKKPGYVMHITYCHRTVRVDQITIWGHIKPGEELPEGHTICPECIKRWKDS